MMNEQKAPKWTINSMKHTELARQAAMVMLFLRGIRWTGSPTNAWLADQMGEQDLYTWWNVSGRARRAARGAK